jgi:CDP-diglyceride synthetase
MLELKLLLLIGVANGTPVIAKRLLGDSFAAPLDLNRTFIDGGPLLGPSKTFRGLVLAVLSAALCAPMLGLAWQHGLWIGAAAMAGDLFSSFIKRRLGMTSSVMALGLDQIPESLLPAIIGKYLYDLSWISVVILVGAFFVLELLLSFILYKLNIRNVPY